MNVARTHKLFAWSRSLALRPWTPQPVEKDVASRSRRTSLGLSLGLPLLACALFSGMVPAPASAMPEMRGEWRLVGESESTIVEGVAIISQPANVGGEFAASEVTFLGVDPGTFTGTIKGTEASVVITAEASGGFPASEFKSDSIKVEEGAGSLVLTGPGTATQGSRSASATLTATRIKTYAEVEERLQREREEAEARSGVRGEWALLLEVGSQTLQGVARISEEADAENRFASSSTQFEGGIAGSFAGTLEGGKATVTITTQATGSYPAVTFTSSSIAVSSPSEPTSMSGSGTVESGGTSLPATLTATRIENYAQLREAEAREREAQEEREREAREALEHEAKERAERQAREREAVQQPPAMPIPVSAAGSTGGQPLAGAALPARLSATRLVVTRSGLVSLPLANADAFAVHGRVTLLLPASLAGSSAHRHGRPKPLVLASAGFAISPAGHAKLAVRLSKAGRSLLARRHALRVLAVVSTQSASQAAVSKTYSLTLQAAPGSRRR